MRSPREKGNGIMVMLIMVDHVGLGMNRDDYAELCIIDTSAYRITRGKGVG